MAEAKHTPGPWDYALHTVEGVQTFNAMVTRDDAPLCLVIADMVEGTPEEQNANARLMAAAPDLLAALKAVVAVADRRTVEFDAARAAIAKAEGR